MINPSLEETDKKSTITTKGPLSHDQIAEDVPVITIDPRSLLEVADGMHRYGKNLRMYFREFTTTFPDFQPLHYHSFHEKLQSFQPFFTWLDKPGGRPSELKDCSFQALDSDRVEYLNCDEGRSPYKYHINQEGLLEHVLTHQLLTTQAKGDMFVLKDNFFYVNEKRTKTIPRFHHSSFFGGDFVNSAGIIIAEKGRIKVVFPHSGHYRPLDRHLLWLLLFLQSQTINLSTILVDAQRIFKVSRHADKENGPKSKKMDCVYLLPGNFVLDFLRAKFKSMDLGLLAEIKSFHDRNVSLKPIVQPVSSAPSSSSLVRAQVLETILLDSVETYQEREGKSTSSTITQSHATPLPHSTKPPRRVTSTSYTLLSNEELLQVDRDLHLLLAESPAMNAVSRKIHLSSPPTSTPDAFHALKERDSRDILSKPSLREIDLFDESSSRSDSSKRLCEFEDKMMSAPFSSMLHPVTANNTSSSDSVSHDCKPPTIIIPLLVSNSCFSRSTSTANLNILSSSSPVLN